MKNTLLGLIMLFAISGCKENRTEQIAQIVSEWKDKEIKFPEPIIFTQYATDTIDYKIPDAPYKVVVFVDSVGCTSCKLKLDKWKELISYMDSVTGSKIPFLFFFQHADTKEIKYLLRRERFDMPVCVDTDNKLHSLNHFPENDAFHTFLVDRDNKVVVIGNPVNNYAVRNLYMREILDENQEMAIQHETTLELDKLRADLGKFPVNETREAVFELKNTGLEPLVILNANASCGCTHVDYDKKPAKTGEVLRVKVTLKPDKPKVYKEIVTLTCNVQEIVKIGITGEAE